MNGMLTGTRYLRRGVDEHGHVGNFVETEMVRSMFEMKKDRTCLLCTCLKFTCRVLLVYMIYTR